MDFFNNAKLGIILAVSSLSWKYYSWSHYEILWRRKIPKETKVNKQRQSLRMAFSALHQARIKDKRPIGKLLGDAVMSSIQTLLMIGGFIILFSVINKLLFHLHISSFLAKGIDVALKIISVTS